MAKEAKARIKINELLKEAGWKFFDDVEGKSNIVLENNVKITESHIDEFGENFETTKNGFVDFLLLDKKGFPFIVLEAKSEDKHALAGKEQARRYAQSQHCRFIILSNGNSHYFWDLQRGNPVAITRFPSPDSVEGYSGFKPNPDSLVREFIEKDYISLTQKPDYKNDPSWLSESTRAQYIQNNYFHKLLFVYKYLMTLSGKTGVRVPVGASDSRKPPTDNVERFFVTHQLKTTEIRDLTEIFSTFLGKKSSSPRRAKWHFFMRIRPLL